MLADKLRPYVRDLQDESSAGNRKAAQVIALYQMHVRYPQDPAVPVLCEAAFDDWFAARATAHDPHGSTRLGKE